LFCADEPLMGNCSIRTKPDKKDIFPKMLALFKNLDTFASLLKEAKSLRKTKVIGV
jgi:hypothetical protein